MYIYIQSEKYLWTVGFYDPKGHFVPESDIPRERKRQCEFTGSMVDLYFPIYAMKTMMENNHETRYGGGAMNLREIPEGYMMQQVGVTALRNGDGSFRPAVPIYMLVPTAAAIEAGVLMLPETQEEMKK